MTYPNDTDPFASESAPAISFKDEPIGTVKKMTATGPATMVQSRDFETGELATWPDGNPKMSAVVNGVDEHGEPCSLWAQKPSSLFGAIAQAQKDSGTRIGDGVGIAVKFTGEKPNSKNPRLHAQKLYAVKLTAPAPKAADDAFGDEPPF